MYDVVAYGVTDLHIQNLVEVPWTYADVTEFELVETDTGGDHRDCALGRTDRHFGSLPPRHNRQESRLDGPPTRSHRPGERGYPQTDQSRAATMALVGHERAVGWHQDHDDGYEFRYWNGAEWTARANIYTDARGTAFVGASLQRKRRRVLISGSSRIP